MQVGLRVLVWVAVLGVAFLVLGPEVFDSGRRANPVGSTGPLYLPPEKPAQLLAWEQQAASGTLGADDRLDYEAGMKSWWARFWSGDGLSVEAALSDVRKGRRAYLIDELEARGLSEAEVAVFLAVVIRDRPDLLQDPE